MEKKKKEKNNNEVSNDQEVVSPDSVALHSSLRTVAEH